MSTTIPIIEHEITPEFLTIVKALQQLSSTNDELYQLKVRMIGEILLLKSDEKLLNEKTSSVVSRVNAYIQKNYEHDINLDSIAQEVSVSRSHLMRLYKKITGQTIGQYVSQCRIEKSKLFLKAYSVTETAFLVGFNNSNYFSTVFKRLTQQTPGEYLQSLSL